jgi:GntR family transcriptional regulator
VIIIDYRDHRPIYEQVIDRFQELILKGALEPDSQLPSVRNLAVELSINPNTIQRAYAELERQGYIYSIKGKGNFIAANKKLRLEKRNDLLKSFTGLVKEANEMGITLEELITIVNEGYREGSDDD